MEIYGKRTVFSGKLKGNGNFHFSDRKLLGKCPFRQNFQPKNMGKFHHFLQFLCDYVHFQLEMCYFPKSSTGCVLLVAFFVVEWRANAGVTDNVS